MDCILQQCEGPIGIADDVAVYGRTETEHDENQHQLIKVASENGLIFNSNKCHMKKKSIPFLGVTYTE